MKVSKLPPEPESAAGSFVEPNAPGLSPVTENPYSVVRIRRWRRQVQLEALGYRDYRAYLRSPHWASVKARYRASGEPQDCICGSEEVQLHHLSYDRMGAEELVDLTPLCPTCHAMIHELERRGDMGLDFAGLVNQERAKRNQAHLDEVGSRFRQERLAEWQPFLSALDRVRVAIAPVVEKDPSLTRVLGRLRRAAHKTERDVLRLLPPC